MTSVPLFHPLNFKHPFFMVKKNVEIYETMVSKEMFNMKGGRDILGYQAYFYLDDL